MILADPQNAVKADNPGKKVLVWTERRGEERRAEKRRGERRVQQYSGSHWSGVSNTKRQGGDRPDSCVLLCYC